MYKYIVSFFTGLLILGSILSISFSYGFFINVSTKSEIVLGLVILLLFTLLIYEWVFGRLNYKKEIQTLKEELSNQENKEPENEN